MKETGVGIWSGRAAKTVMRADIDRIVILPDSMNGRCTSLGSVGRLHDMVGAHIG